MITRLQKPFSTLLALLFAMNTLVLSGASVEPDASSQARVIHAEQSAQAGMPDELMRAFLEASSQPFEPGAGGYHARSGGLDFTLEAGGLQASGEGFAWSLALYGFGREGQIVSVSDPAVAQAGDRLEYRRGSLTEWYRNTALGVEQGFTLHQAPGGAGPLILQLDLSTSFEDLKVTADEDGGLLFALPTGQTLRYDHLRAWDADGASLDAQLSYTAGKVCLEITDQTALYPITVDPLIYLEQKVTAYGAPDDRFGVSVALTDDTALVGVTFGDVPFIDEGAAYVFTRSGTEWSLQAQLAATAGSREDGFGYSVALSGDTALVGAPNDDVGNIGNQGSAYIFTRSGTIWMQQAQLIDLNGASDDRFGSSVSLSGDTALVGACEDDVGENYDQGSAYVFTRSGTVWSLQAQLTATDGEGGDWFGASVALSGETALLGAWRNDVGENEDQGSAYIFTRSGTTWTQQAQMIAMDGEGYDRLGSSVALSGDTALVATYSDDSAYVFTRSTTVWTQQAKLTAADVASEDFFGSSLALSGDTALVGVYDDDIGSNYNLGSAYVFTRSGTTWTQQAQLTSADGEINDCFGSSVALSGDTALVGAPWDDVGGNHDQGSAYVFNRTGTTWTQQARLTTNNGAAVSNFGISVALSGNTALVGADYTTIGSDAQQGAAYVFVHNGFTWAQQAQLTAADGEAGDYFGHSVALFGETALVGAWRNDVGIHEEQGSAYVFTRSGTTWMQQAQLTAADGAADDRFGCQVALSGDSALVGAYEDDVGVNYDQGSAYVFTRSGTTWTQQAQLTSADGASEDYFGQSVSLSANTALVGAPADYIGVNYYQGSAYVFTRSGTTWTQQAQLIAAGGASEDDFGKSVAVIGDTALVGAPYDDVGANVDQGSAYIFTRNGTIWTQQAQLIAADGETDDRFGISVALWGARALVGAFFGDVGTLDYNQGSAYIFTRSGIEWTQQEKLAASDGAYFDNFGRSVALSSDTALVGTPGGGNRDQGSAYFYNLPVSPAIYLPVVFRNIP